MPCKSLSDVINIQTPTLIYYAQKAGDESYEQIKSYIANYICDMFSFFDKSKPSQSKEELEIQVAKYLKVAKDVSELIIEEYNDMPLESIGVFFKNVKKGTYGNPYGQISGSDIMRWFNEFYQEYWKEYHAHKKQEEIKEVKQTDECFVEVPESVQRIFNKLAGKGHRTDAECEHCKTIEQIRKDVINKNMYLYSTMSVEEADRAMDNKIKVALMAEGIFE